jgi:hypothetical protein
MPTHDSLEFVIPRAEILVPLPNYRGEHGWPTFADIKPFLPDYYGTLNDSWEGWDTVNKYAVIMKWEHHHATLADMKKWENESNEASKRVAEQERKHEEEQEQKRIARVNKQREEDEKRSAKLREREEQQIRAREEEADRRARADAIHAEQMEANKRRLDSEKSKRVEKLLDETALHVSEVALRLPRLMRLLSQLPAERRRETGLDGLLLGFELIKKDYGN